MGRIFILTSWIFILLWGCVGPASKSTALRVEAIDAQIEELKEKKRGFEARALKQDDMAQYLQFNQRADLETRRHIELAEENRAKAAEVQKKIDLLEEEKKKLLRGY